MKEYKVLNFSFEIGMYPLWTNEGHPLELEEMQQIGLSDVVVQRICNITDWYYCYLNPVYQGLPSLWQQGVCDAFNREAHALFAAIVDELPHIKITTNFSDLKEDPELYEYLDRPVQYYKRRGITGDL